ncbi:thiamine/thiamine pyrophosphate ABC transporter permease [Chelativorans salis]|uniref:Thiamine transport system permease protein ThiP n=1 Tax=Chelativorans salis TaxID=2978478 RepID=A0ABT2LPX6_9HYPH|nr:thiamine/thiamine pyrophosphate ABC transporter permease [Chelativorans sp. EGI FJ00035]MCT7376598.1 thiamine/thiamine pyrophosphate ABC transporter permease [Chelativorans sp. EGI FJ00035]
MAVRDEPVTAPRQGQGRVAAGALALAAIGLLIGGAFFGLGQEALTAWRSALAAFDPYLLRVARFTLWQAALSTLLSVAPAILVARALARHPRFFGRGLILQLFAVPLALPAIVAALGVLALYGRAGYFAPLFSALSEERWPGIYGLSGILVAHVFFNLPLSARLFLAALENVPADQWRLSAQLGMGVFSSFRFIEWPVLRAALPGVAGLVFMLCATSFTIVLTLGGGPRATTLEVAIYQALRFDFDPARAISLTLVQVALTGLIVLALGRLGAVMTGDASLPVAPRRTLFLGRGERGVNAAVIVLALVFVAGPMAATVAAGLQADLGRLAGENAVLSATLTSLVLSALAALLCLLLSVSLVMARRALELARAAPIPGLLERMSDTGATMVLIVPPIVIGAGWFILLRHFGDVFAFAPVMVVTVNAVMAMPFAIRAVRPAYDAASARHEKLCAALGISGWNRLRLVDWPALRKPAAMAFAFAMALSLGDLGVIALFGSDRVQTLPYLLLQRMASYRTADAAGIALFLGLLCLGLMFAATRWGKGRG